MDILLQLYRTMLLIRLTEERIGTLVEAKKSELPVISASVRKPYPPASAQPWTARIQSGGGIVRTDTIWPKAET
jgi:hypothetical protein